jgi:RimJ/RimL family protein N-acetyltransferase
MVWWLFHVLHIFANRSYRVIVISHEGTPVHRSCIFPGYFRFPFMESQDLQVGDTWTSPEHRGKGLATWGLCEAIKVAQKSGGRVWYLVDDDNPASIRVCTKVGMRQVGTGRRTRRMGLRLFGAYVMEGNHDG